MATVKEVAANFEDIVSLRNQDKDYTKSLEKCMLGAQSLNLSQRTLLDGVTAFMASYAKKEYAPEIDAIRHEMLHCADKWIKEHLSIN